MRLEAVGKRAGVGAAACALAAAGLLSCLLRWSADTTHSVAMLLLAGLLWAAGKAVLAKK